jgi:hypothetical protein
MSATTETTYRDERSNELAQANQLTLSWVLIGGLAGTLGVVAFFLASTGLLALKPSFYLGMAMGPLLSVAFVGYYYFFRAHRLSPALQIATVFGVIAGSIVNRMIVVQGALFITFPAAARESMGAAWDGFNIVQLGLDVSWDIYISLATVLLAVAMWGHPRFHKILALVTGLLGAGVLVLNLLAYPIPPDSAGSFDLGPVVGVWYLVLSLRILGSRQWLAERLAASGSPAVGEEVA